MNWKERLRAHYTAPLESSFRQFRWGFSLFFCGLVLIFGASQLLEVSLAQELVVLLGLLVGGCGFIIAMLAQVRMMISRIWRFFSRPPRDSDIS